MEYLNRIFYDGNDVISLPYGDRWRKLRNIILHELLNSSRVRSFGSIREEETSLLMARIEELSAASEPVNLTRMLAAASNALITRAAFGKKYSETEHGKMFLEFVEEASGMFEFSLRDSFPWLGWIDRLNGRDAAVDRLVEKRDASLDSIIQDHLQSSDASRDNIMGILLGNYKGDIPGVSIDLMSIKGTMKGKHHVTDDDLQEMPYMKAVIKELIRLHPPLPIFSRVARDHVNLMGYEVAPSTLVLINAWAIGQDPAYWEEPEKFMPERFLDSSIDFKGHDFHLIPFGSGRRICPGYGFATAAIGHMVANLMLRFDWALPNGAQGEDLDVTERPGFAIGKDSALIVVATINPNI
ncbi:hypothetical protein SASPL_153554 [Salvia splendens]|uniref:Uncharacterized protein n=1 Tax=Salvia splendens TaxID=180675 RepID=A0A8X8VYQ4_SALSN|nr:hypothetical protein SASPL_153554 [Salvia splendens]